MELFCPNSAVPLDLSVAVVGEEASACGDIVPHSTGELGGSKHHTGVEEPPVGETEALDDLDGRHAWSAAVVSGRELFTYKKVGIPEQEKRRKRSREPSPLFSI